MATSMAGKKEYGLVLDFTLQDRTAWLAKGRLQHVLLGFSQASNFIQA